MIYRYLGSTIMIALLGFLALMGTPDAKAKTAIGSVNAPSLLQFTSGGHSLGFTQDSVYLDSRSNALRVEFVNARPTTPITAPTTGEAQRATPMTQVTYPGLWPGVTLTYDAPPGGILRSTYRIEPHSDVSQIRLRYNAPVKVEANGELSLTCSAGVIHESPPVAWQEQDAGNKESIAVAFEQLGEREVGFKVSEYDPTRPLFIDPTLTWNTFLGGGQNNYGTCIAVDVDGNSYITGYGLTSWGSPTRPFTSGYDAFVAKFDTSGNLIWNSFLGGNGHDQGQGISLDEDGNIYVTGDSFATWGSPVRAFTGSSNDAFVAKLDKNGVLIWNTFLGSSESEQGHGISADRNGNVYVTGESYGTWGSPVNPYNNTYSDTFVAKLDNNGNLIWNTFLGGGAGWGLAVAENGTVYVAGTILLAKLDSGGNLIWKQTPGGGSPVYGIKLDGNENVYITGFSLVSWGSPIRPFTDYDAFVAKLDSGGNLTWNTFLGGSGGDVGHGISIDGNGNVYVTGESSDATWGSPIRQFNGIVDAFAVKLDGNGNLLWNTFLGGSAGDQGLGIAIDINKNVYVVGMSNNQWGSPILPHANIGNDAFVAKLRGNFIISGYVRTSEGVGINGVTINGLPNVQVTDGNGFYTAIVDSGWSGTVTPVKAGYSFNPSFIWHPSVLTDRYDQNYTGTLIPLTISGYIRTPGGDGINGVRLTGIPGNPISEGNGYFTGTINYGWSGTVIPEKEGYSFNPSSWSYSSVENNQSNQNHTGTLIPLIISGYVRTSGSAGISGATLNGLPGSPTTDGNGFYTRTLDYGWSGTVIPSKYGYSFNPFSISYSNLAANQSNQNYTGLSSTTTRNLPSYYVPSYPVPVTIDVIADPSKIIYVVEDSPPSGWTVKNISHNGLWDNSSKKVKWGPFYDHKNRSLSYEATPPWGESGTKTFGPSSFRVGDPNI